MNSLQYTYNVHANLSHLLKVSSRLKSTQVDMPLSSQVMSSRMCSSRPPSAWGHFSLKSGQVFVPQRLPCLIRPCPHDLNSQHFTRVSKASLRLMSKSQWLVGRTTIVDERWASCLCTLPPDICYLTLYCHPPDPHSALVHSHLTYSLVCDSPWPEYLSWLICIRPRP